MIRKYLLILTFLLSIPATAQKQVNKHSGVWLGYFNQTRLNSFCKKSYGLILILDQTN